MKDGRPGIGVLSGFCVMFGAIACANAPRAPARHVENASPAPESARVRWPYCPLHARPAEAASAPGGMGASIHFTPCPGSAELGAFIEEDCDANQERTVTYCNPTLSVVDATGAVVASRGLGQAVRSQNEVEGTMSSFELDLDVLELGEHIEVISVTMDDLDYMMTLHRKTQTLYAVDDDGSLAPLFSETISETARDEDTGERVDSKAELAVEKARGAVGDIVVSYEGPPGQRDVRRFRFTGAAYEGTEKTEEAPVAPPAITEGAVMSVARASAALRSAEHRAEVDGKEIRVAGYVVRSTIDEVPPRAVHRAGLEDPQGCAPPVPTFWLADTPRSPPAESMRVMGWASNHAVIYDAIRLADRGVSSSTVDGFWGVTLPHPLPAVGARVVVVGRYGTKFEKATVPPAPDPVMGILDASQITTLTKAPVAARLRGMPAAR